MRSWGAEVEVPCGCGAVLRWGVGQFVRDGRLGWDGESWCPACNGGGCLGFGYGEAPEWVRGPVLERYGPVRVRLVDPAAGRGAVLRVVRGAWPVTPAHASALAALLAGAGLPGTPAEADWLCGLLAERGLAAETVPKLEAGAAGIGAGAGVAAAEWPWPPHA
ncbi:hypothetical protein HUT16_07880 [Kitasatospora sp. NA04385]|uniref:hypothetical protein n=1 Tax=Kitasatospora sp. NA04385 TaxID=2742135 RepID=UPI0015916663|nr:hypothetical protein [Kitasatospora sp. NA04385]QKW18994.1 hypothetical protein HUT16_07880 [Kitasatospora sp. NA04385]